MTPEEHWTEHAPRPSRPRLGPILHRVAAELPHISEAKGMRMEGGTRLAFLSFYGVQNARTLVVHAAEPTSKSVSLLALDEAFLRAAVAAAGWTRGPVQHDQVDAAGPLARWLGPRGSSVACKRRLSRSQWAETLGWLVSKLRLVGDKDSLTVCVEPVQAVPPTPIVERSRRWWRTRTTATSRIWGWTPSRRRTTGDCARPRARRGRRRSLPSCPCRSRPRRRRRSRTPCRRPRSSRMGAWRRARGRAQRDRLRGGAPARCGRGGRCPTRDRTRSEVLGARIDTTTRLINESV